MATTKSVTDHLRNVFETVNEPPYLACVASVSNRVIARKLERKQRKGWSSFVPLPLPRHSFFFLLLSQLSRRTSRGNACYAGYTLLRATACCFHHILIIGAPVRNIVGVGVRDSSNRIDSTRTTDVSEGFEMFVWLIPFFLFWWEKSRQTRNQLARKSTL